MKHRRQTLFIAVLLPLISCGDPRAAGPEEQAEVERIITKFHRALETAYGGGNVNLAAEIDGAFDGKARYVTYWGQDEPIDTTRARMLGGVGKVKDYTNAVENIETRVYGNGAVLTCIVRQEYDLNGHRIDEFLPTTYVLEKKEGMWKVVFVHRSADFQTIQQQLDISREP